MNKIPCWYCDGTGCTEEHDTSVGWYDTVPCSVCSGTGENQIVVPSPEEKLALEKIQAEHKASRERGEPSIDDTCPF